MKRLLVSDAARADLKGIARYSEREWGKVRKTQYLAAIRARFGALRHQPEIGWARRDIGAAYRSLPVGRHVIFYRIEREAVVIVRVLHQRMDASVHLTPPDAT
jgi:toxin ParE1/3/4